MVRRRFRQHQPTKLAHGERIRVDENAVSLQSTRDVVRLMQPFAPPRLCEHARRAHAIVRLVMDAQELHFFDRLAASHDLRPFRRVHYRETAKVHGAAGEREPRHRHGWAHDCPEGVPHHHKNRADRGTNGPV